MGRGTHQSRVLFFLHGYHGTLLKGIHVSGLGIVGVVHWHWSILSKLKSQNPMVKGTVSRDFLIRFMTLKTKSVLFVQALIV
jgi:hypothetical protein